MHIDRYMVNLFFEIRRNLPHDLQRDLKISDVSLEQKLIVLHKNTQDESIKTLIEVFLERAGDGFLEKVLPKKDLLRRNLFAPSKANAPKEQKMNSKPKKSKPKRMYRGVLVDD